MWNLSIGSFGSNQLKNVLTLLLIVSVLGACAPTKNISTPQTASISPVVGAGATPAVTPTLAPEWEEFRFYDVSIEYECSSNFCSIEFLNHDVISAISQISYGDDVKVSLDYPFINIDRHSDKNVKNSSEILKFNIAVSADNIDNTIQIQSRHGSTGGSVINIFLNANNEKVPLEEIQHFHKTPGNIAENPEIFPFSLQVLRDYTPRTRNILTSPGDKMVWAVYYPWIAWNQNLECTDHPLLTYQNNDDGSRTIETYREEIKMAKSAGIDGFFVSWFNDPVSNHDLQSLLDAAQELDFKIAIYLESLLDGSVNPEIEGWIRHAIGTFGSQPAYMRLNDKPVIMVYGYLAAPFADWKTRFANLRAQGFEASYFPDSVNPVDLDISTGLHRYINLDKNDLEPVNAALARSVHMISREFERKFFVATVSPGFNNCPYDAGNPLDEISRENGAFYERQFTAAINANPDWIMITSWNEFGESTHVRPSEKYGVEYLEMTRFFIEKWKTPQR